MLDGYYARVASSASFFVSIFELGLCPLLINTTDPMIMAAAKRMRGVNGSLANKLPRKTATTGLTYAYVDTNEMGAFCNNQPYDTNPTNEPMKIKKARPSHERIETAAKWNPFNSPVAALTMNNATAPVNISAPVPINDDFGISACLV